MSFWSRGRRTFLGAGVADWSPGVKGTLSEAVSMLVLLDEPRLERERRQSRTRTGTQSHIQISNMGRYGGWTDRQGLRNLLACVSPGEEAKHLHFAPAQAEFLSGGEDHTVRRRDGRSSLSSSTSAEDDFHCFGSSRSPRSSEGIARASTAQRRHIPLAFLNVTGICPCTG